MDPVQYPRWAMVLLVMFHGIRVIVAPPAVVKERPVNQEVPDHPDNMEKAEDDIVMKHNLEYNRYLKEVVEALESDPEFRKKLETAEEVDFRNGKVASELEYVNHHVRTKLDELKRTELERLRELMRLDEEKKKAEQNHHHLDHSNPHTFEVQDLQMLMNKVRTDLDKADLQRREEFKEYEMQKEFEKEQKLKGMDDEHKKAYLKELEDNKKTPAQVDTDKQVHHPGSKAQLEEVWEKTDHMTQNFDPKAFFYLHDLDGNGYWDEQEVNSLFIKELDKIYSYAPNNRIDTREREEEMERMREHVFKETDSNRDRFISYQEFLEQTKRDEWRRDEGWNSIDQKPQFTQKEYEEFERRRQDEIRRLIDQGVLPAYPEGSLPPHQFAGQLPVVHGEPQYQLHSADAQQQYGSHPAVAQQQYGSHPAQQQYGAHPAPAQQQYGSHPAQPQHGSHPAPAQPQYGSHPAPAQPQHGSHPAPAQPQHGSHPAPAQPQHGSHPAPVQPQNPNKVSSPPQQPHPNQAPVQSQLS